MCVRANLRLAERPAVPAFSRYYRDVFSLPEAE